MKKFIAALCIICILSVGCITSNTKIRLTDVESGNSITISDQGIGLDIKALQADGMKVELITVDDEGVIITEDAPIEE